MARIVILHLLVSVLYCLLLLLLGLGLPALQQHVSTGPGYIVILDLADQLLGSRSLTVHWGWLAAKRAGEPFLD